jgi:anthranilate 1,2-dioxygenase small subunit
MAIDGSWDSTDVTNVTSSTRIDADVRAQIDDLIADYAHAIDDDALERWPSFFSENATYKVISRENYEADMPLGIISCLGRGMMEDRIEALRNANIFEPHTYCHLLGRTRLASDPDNEGCYLARTNFSVIRTMQSGDSVRFATGKYVDTITFDTERPVFASRIAVLESRRIDALLVIPI